MFRIVRTICLAAMTAGLGGCAISPPCPPDGGTPMMVFQLFFGQSIAGRGDLTAKEWQGFLDDTITVNLPSGFTVMNASGAWLNPTTHRTIHEPSRVLVVALPDDPESVDRINRIRTAYQIRFHQQLVGMTAGPVCGAF